jgi:hypothetical protein
MFAEVARRLRVTFIEESMDSSTLSFTVLRSALKRVASTIFYVLNQWDRLKEGVDRCNPLFGESF